MSRCARCGEENAERARFCSACGATLVEERPPAEEARKTVTVLFCDVADSTRLGERLDPEAHRRMIGRYFDEMRTVLERHGGRVEKFIGDAVMAVFGVPAVHEDDALRAARAAVEMRQALESLNAELERSWDVRIEVRTGVNTGEVVAGDAAGPHSLVTGDAVVVAKRLEETAAPGEIQIGDSTYRLVKDGVHAEAAGPIAAKGKDALPRWRLLDVLPGAEVTPLRVDSPLVGRELELGALEATFERAVGERSCQVFTVLGPPGIGKSRLVHEFVAGVGERATVARGRCLPYGDGITFWPLVEIVRQVAGLTDEDAPNEARAKLAAVLPAHPDSAVVAERVAAVIGRGEAADTRAEATFWAVRRFFEAVAVERPFVAVFDDIQWAETTLLDLIEYLAGWSQGSPVLLCCLARLDLLDIRPSWAVPKPRTAAIALDPLPAAQSEQLVEALLGGLPLAHDARTRIVGSAEGNPLFVQEIVRMLVDGKVVHKENGRWTAAPELSHVDIPPSIHALLSARLDRLELEERAVVQRAAVVGQVFWWSAVADLSPPAARAQVGARLQSLVRKDLVRQEPSLLPGEDAFRFTHILIRDAAYAGLAKEVRADLHEVLAGWLERRAGERTAEYEELVGYHLEQAFLYRRELGRREQPDLAVHAAERLGSAGRRAVGRGDASAALGLLRRATDLLARDDPFRLELLIELGRAVKEGGDPIEAGIVLDEAIAGARTLGDRRLEARAVVARALERLGADRAVEEALAAAERAIAVLEELDDDLGLAWAWILVGQARWFQCRSAAMEAALGRGLVHAERAGSRRDRLTCLNGLARVALVGLRPAEDAIARCEEILEEAKPDPILEAQVAAALAGLRAMREEFERARDLCRRSRAIFGDLGQRVALGALSQYAAYVELLAGDLAAAEHELRAGYDALVRMGERPVLSTVAAGLGHVLHAQGRDADAWEFTAIAERAAVADDLVSQVLWRGARAKLLARRDVFDRAEQLAQQAVRIGEATDFLDLQGAAQLDLAAVLEAVRPDAAREAARAAADRFERKGNVVAARRARRVAGTVETARA